MDFRGDNGLGSKHNEMGFDGFQGFGDDVGAARDQARDRAGETQKEADGQMNRARDLNNMGDQIGKDRNQLLPQVQQAKQQDQRNSSGSSSLQKLLQKPYNPPKKYQEAIHALGLRNNGELYYKGPKVQEQLYTKAEDLSTQAQRTYDKAAQGFQAARKLQSFQQIATARAAGMRNVQNVYGAANNSSATARNGGLGLGRNGSNDSYGGSLTSEKIGSGISDRSEKGAESNGSGSLSVASAGGGGAGGSRGLASTSFDGKIDMKMKGAPDSSKGASDAGPGAGKPPEKGELRRSLEKNFAALDALFDHVAGKASDKPAASLSSALGGGAAPTAANEPMETLKAVLQIEERPAAEDPVAAPGPATLAMVESSGEQGSGFLLEEESLFQRIRHSYLRAAQDGRIARP